MKSIYVLRKPCSEPTVAANVVRHGAGAINIEATRVATGANEPDSGAMFYKNRGLPMPSNRQSYFGQDSDALVTSKPMPNGRWPANLVLQHLEGCRQDGTREVNVIGATAHRKEHRTHSWVPVGNQAHAHEGFRNSDGTETVAAWACVHGCPVAALDRSGLTSVTGHRSSRSATAEVKGTTWGTTNHQSREYPNDSGSASRFFKQVKS
jgi:hypothetical protein